MIIKTMGILVIFTCFSATASKLVKSDVFSAEQCNNEKSISIDCGKTPSTIFDKNGRLWAVFEFNQTVYVNYSNDFGKTFSVPVSVNRIPETIYTNGENRPKIQLGLNDEIYVSWNQKTAGSYTGDIRFSRSVDLGQSFSPVVTINDDKLLTGHRFESLAVTNDGSIFISWIDKRDRFNLKTRSKADLNSKPKSKSTASIYYSYSVDSGKTFSKNERVAESTCVCCRIAMIPIKNDQVALLWRHVFDGNIRDHAYATIGKDGVTLPMQRASYDYWKIEACPHHGPSMAEDDEQNKHLVWFTASEKNKGVFYTRRSANNNQYSHLVNITDKASASHPYVDASKNRINLVWKEFDGQATNIMYQSSDDRGVNWDTPLVLTTTKGESDHPFLIESNQETWLSWSTQNEGFRLINLNSESRSNTDAR